MFDSNTTEDVFEETSPSVAASVISRGRRPEPLTDMSSVPRHAYGARRGVNLPAALIVIALHIVLIGALIQARHNFVKLKPANLNVFNLAPPPPPPEAAPPPPPAPQLAAPLPRVQIPAAVTAPVPVAVVPDPVPPPPEASPAPVPPAPPPPQPSIVETGDMSTRMVSGKAPTYPIESRRKHEMGTVVLSVTLDLDGSVASITIARTSGFKRLDDVARDAVRRWRWQPTLRSGHPVQVRGLVEIPFVLQG